MTQDNTQPLYRILNEKRTQGEWRADERPDAKDSDIPYSIIVPYSGACQPVFDSAAFPPNNQGCLARMEADAQYTVLSVNHLAKVADALRGLIDDLENHYKPIYILSSTASKINEAKEALAAIS